MEQEEDIEKLEWVVVERRKRWRSRTLGGGETRRREVKVNETQE